MYIGLTDLSYKELMEVLQKLSEKERNASCKTRYGKMT